jgi:hypothetical protein
LVWDDLEFWFDDAELCIRPFCQVSFLMQRNGNTMAHVMLVIINLYDQIHDFCGHTEDEVGMLKDIERRWFGQDQPLFSLAFALHPIFRNTAVAILKKSKDKHGSEANSGNTLTLSRLVEAAEFYCTKHNLFETETDKDHEKELKCLGKHMKAWLRGDRVNVDDYDPAENEVEHWKNRSCLPPFPILP